MENLKNLEGIKSISGQINNLFKFENEIRRFETFQLLSFFWRNSLKLNLNLGYSNFRSYLFDDLDIEKIAESSDILSDNFKKELSSYTEKINIFDRYWRNRYVNTEDYMSKNITLLLDNDDQFIRLVFEPSNSLLGEIYLEFKNLNLSPRPIYFHSMNRAFWKEEEINYSVLQKELNQICK